MVTTRRSEGFATESGFSRGGVELLERNHVAYETVAPEKNETTEEKRERMRRNLNNLLNYDRFSEIEDRTQEITAEEVKAETTGYSDEDINPTTTTTQFINGDPQIFNDAEKSKEYGKSAYKLNGKGKLVVVLYALVVTVILALIVLNTGVLKSLSGEIASLGETYNARLSAISAQETVINELSSETRIANIAENEFGMVFGE